MKKSVLFVIILLTSLFSFSQNLTPKVHQINGDTLLCFSIDQSREIAIHIQSEVFKDSLIYRLETRLETLEKISLLQDSTIVLLTQKIDNLETINTNLQTSQALLKEVITHQKKQLKRSKFQKLMLGTGITLLTILTIAK